jgi:hypothetical protein
MAITVEGLLRFMQSHRYAVQSSVHNDGTPQSAVIGVAVSDRGEVVFDTLGTSRKAGNLRAAPAIALVFGSLEPDAARTVQLEGVADEPGGDERERLVNLYCAVFPDGRQRQQWPDLTYFRVTPRWLRYADFSIDPPEIVERDAAWLQGGATREDA